MSNYTSFDQACANVIRTLTLDAVQTANSGHPGMPLGMADVAYVLYAKFMRFNPRNPKWFNRDRFIVSAGHGSMLPYAILHLTGYEAMTLDEIKRFRQYGSITPGHPENHLTPGIEVTTGPLGSGTANSVGMALAEAWLAAKYNRDGFNVIDHYTYAIVSDGDLMEGVSHEAASLAGHLGLGKLIWFYDDNAITIDGPTALTYSDDVPKRFEAYGWHTITIDAHNMAEVEAAIHEARAVTDRPTLISCKSIIGKGMPHRQGTREAHSDAPGWEEVRAAKLAYGADPDKTFHIPDDVLRAWRAIGERAAQAEAEWQATFEAYRRAHPDCARELEEAMAGRLPKGWAEAMPNFDPSAKPMATRAASGAVINAIISKLPTLLGGSADLTPSNNTLPKDAASLRKGDFSGRYIHYGVREHAMAGIMNGMALHGAVIPYGGTFFCFSDFMRPAIRLAALSHAHVIFVFTHDSIGLGEDGPTHQPIEQLASLRAMPNLLTLRPADANETVAAWKVAIEWKHGPVALLLTRQAVPILPKPSGFERGAYVVHDVADPQIALVASGSEVSLALDAAKALAEQGVRARVVSFPSWELFDRQDDAYRQSVLPFDLPKVVVEAGVSQGWERYTGPIVRFVALDNRFGASAPFKDVYRQLGFTVERVVEEAMKLLS
ncbi:MAG: transketolase [Chloroflexi bacterium]|jgi:transketolase|uniref:Transketolase n=1 Tax=Candidatus Thermofonsia Clade 3 bacterium TaxID=2364212 RepID=A0A2M8QDU1_9CHLR|nr:transketolase [Candidatus Roseilinea sp. NK_OTU-006]PJF47971.1 MAG: transketolase [Candidatus Thermofonsia Clade 3 bacterium]RMG65302.1 MAG: transketolase [Chloroflexota bacterium]